MRAVAPLLLLLAAGLAGGCGEREPASPPDPSVTLRASLEESLAGTVEGPERVALRIRIATVRLQGSRSPDDWSQRLAAAVDELRALRDDVAAAGDASAEAQVRVALGKHLAMSRRFDEAAAELDWVLAHAPDSPHAPAALTEKANSLWRQEDYAGCRALLERVIAEHPGSPEALAAPRGIESCDRELAE